MRKHAKIKQIVESTMITTEVKAAQLTQTLNQAVEKVIEDFFLDLNDKGLLKDAQAAKSVKDVLLGQVTQPDYPDL